MLFPLLEDIYARTAVYFCEGACLRFLGRRVLFTRAFRLRLRPVISVTLHPAPLHVATVMRDRPVGLSLNEPDVTCVGGQFGSLDES
jgi:hypothetical protein